MVYGISRFLTVVAEVKSEFILERFGDSPKGGDVIKKYSESITIYQKYSLEFAVSKTFTETVYLILRISEKI